jgi:hypothetical protein
MNSLQVEILELVQIAESPVYSTFRWLGRQVGREVSMPEFFRMVDSMIQQDIVQLWAIDPETQVRRRLDTVPPHLEQRYTEIGELDQSFDPLGLSLTAGAAADVKGPLEWGADFDFDRGYFSLTSTPDSVRGAWRQIGDLFPDLEFIEMGRSPVAEGVRIEGAVSERPR